MSKFIAGKRYISHNADGFEMKVESRGTKYLSGTVYQKVKRKEWNPQKGKWETVNKVLKHPFNKAKFRHSNNEDDIWFLMTEYDERDALFVKGEIRVGFVSD